MDQTKYLNADELHTLEHTLALFRLTNLRDILILELLLKTGARASELLSTTVKEINCQHRSVLIRGLKGSRDREIPLSSNLFARLFIYAQTKKPDQPIFPISYHRIAQIWRKYRPCAKKLHSLRHTFAIQGYEKTKDIRLVQKALGHKSIINTMVYQDYVYGVEEFRKLI